MSTTEERIEDIETKYTKLAFQLPDIQEESEAFTLAMEKKKAEEYKLIFKYYNQWKKLAEDKQYDERMAEHTNKLLRFDMPKLDENIKLFGKRLVMIIARSGYGKTSFMAHMIRRQLKDQKRILVFSCEEAGEDFITRLNLTPELDETMVTNFVMSDKGNITLEDIKMTVLKMDMMGIDPDIVYVDQLNKIKPDTQFKGSKHERVVHVSERLQDLVKIIARPLVILHQENRDKEKTSGFSTQGNVSDADAVFNEAQIVMFLESPDFFEWSKNKNPYRYIFEYFINIAKNRSVGGWLGAEVCHFDRSKGLFISEIEYNQYMIRKKL